MKLCQCGCGGIVKTKKRDYCMGHNPNSHGDNHTVIKNGAVFKTCIKCGETKNILEFSTRGKDRGPDARRSNCKKCGVKYQRNSLESNPERKSKVCKQRKKCHRDWKELIIGVYGGRCACCGEDRIEFLCVDHINVGGNKHRESLGKRGRHIYYWLRDNNYPDGFRVLCHNCNFSLGAYGYCPHKEERG